MIAAVSSPVSLSSAHASFVPPSLGEPSVGRSGLGRRQQRQRFLEWDRDEPREVRGDARQPAANYSVASAAASTEQATAQRSAAVRPAPGPRRMGDVMPDVLARYGLKL